MPSFLNFDDTKKDRDFLISKTLQRPNGPQTYTKSNYTVQNIRYLPNVDPGDVKTDWKENFRKSFGLNLFQFDKFKEYDALSTLNLQLGNNGVVYSGYINSFTRVDTGLIGIMTGKNFDNDSKLMQFAVKNIRENKQGPVFSRITQNLTSATLGRIRIADAIDGSLSTALNIITGREPLIQKNYKITVSRTLLGKGVDFLQTVAGVELPFSQIPGDYLTNPKNPIQNGVQSRNANGGLLQDVSGAIGSLIGIDKKRRTENPSDIMVKHMGDGQKQILFNNLSYSKYSPNYSSTALLQQSSKILNFADNLSKGVKNILGIDSPSGLSYIGDDRSENVTDTMSDLNGNIVRSNYYLSLLFDPISSKLFERQRNIMEGGPIGGKLTWFSTNSTNKLGLYNDEWSDESTNLNDSLSTNYRFRKDSILDKTQQILDSMPKDGLASRTHVGNVIDQTSRIFKEGDSMLSRGSAVQYVDKFTKEPTGIEYCRVWTKDRAYLNYSDTMKKTGNVRKFEDSVVSTPWNLNIAPMSDGDRNFKGVSTNIFEEGKDNFYAKKYMFSIENLAWKTSSSPGFTYNDLPYCERGPNGGRVMWFAPYDLKINENNNAKWTENSFIGRTEPIYTYQDTTRTGQLSFKVVVDHPSILNLLVREEFKNMSDEEANNYISAFFSGCEDIDFFSLIKKYTYLDGDDIRLLQSYLEKGKSSEIIKTFKTVVTPIEVVEQNGNNNNGPKKTTKEFNLKFENDFPKPSNAVYVDTEYSTLFDSFYGNKSRNLDLLENDLLSITGYPQTNQVKKEISYVFGSPNEIITTDKINDKLFYAEVDYEKAKFSSTDFINEAEEIKQKISSNQLKSIYITVESSASSLATELYNEKLSLRRSSSVLNDFFKKISKNGTIPNLKNKWITDINPSQTKMPTSSEDPSLILVEKGKPIRIRNVFKLSEFGYENNQGTVFFDTVNYGERFTGPSPETNCIGKDFITVKGLRTSSPISFFCRQSKVKLEYFENTIPPEPVIPSVPPEPITQIIPGEDIVKVFPSKKPLIDPLKRIIMKTLSECYYFKKLEEDSPLVFKSLKEKLKYFHPGFHSTTPEGLNSRLTFLLQCLRPGDTIPIRGVADDNDLNARNTSFGPPPICVLRIGDFYHSKIILSDVNITYEDSTWDFNPEGIGMQPMLANVSCQIKFIGGQGLSKPIERLQNALSSNFFANTEMYDERSISSMDILQKDKYEAFSKKFLNELLTLNNKPKEKQEVKNVNKITEGVYIGVFKDNSLDYSKLIDDVFTNTNAYFESYKKTYNILIKKYGLEIGKLLFSPTYRTIHGYDIFNTTSNTAGKTISLFGLYKETKNLSRLKGDLLNSLLSKLDMTNLSEMLNLDKELTPGKLVRSNEFITPLITEYVKNIINELTEKNPFDELDVARNKLITSLDKVNYIVKFGKDNKINKDGVTSAVLSGFTYDIIYNEYSSCVDFIEKNTSKLYDDLTSPIDFFNIVILDSEFKKIMKVLLSGAVNNVLKEYEKDATVFPEPLRLKIRKQIENFVEVPKEKVFKFSKFRERKNTNVTKFNITETPETNSTAIEEVEKINSDFVEVKDKLNYYKTKKDNK